ncbi:MAG: hypothetical protein ACOH2H_26395 [Cypionkella sp.]
MDEEPDYQKLPGYYRVWDLAQVVLAGRNYRIEDVGVNRTADNPLEVRLLSDVVLPIAYERVPAWDVVCPDIVQQMLLAGLAVDSPADAARLHPGLFDTANAADCAFRRDGFNRQNPIGDLYREMTVKSAAYRLGGRRRGWQRAILISGSAEEAHAIMEAAVGSLAEWVPDQTS